MDLREARALESSGKLADAEALCRRILRADPNDVAAIHLLGRITLRRGRAGEAAELIGRAAALRPDDPAVHSDLAAALGAAGRSIEAIPHLERALALRPNLVEGWNNLGGALHDAGRDLQAVDALRRALQLRPDYVEAHNNIGNALRSLGRLTEATAAYRRALELRPNYFHALNALGAALTDAGEPDRAAAAFRRLVQLHPDSPQARSALLYTLHYLPEYDRADLYREHLEWGKRFCEPLQSSIEPHNNDCNPGRKLRIGYVSPDFRQHNVPQFIGAAFKYHDREQFELFCYSDAARPDEVTRKLQGWVESWRDTHRMDDQSLSRQIREDGIDILVDLRGHATRNRLTMFAHKPAPVQVNNIGYFDTTGLSTMDWRVTDEHMDPPGTESFSTEKLIRLPVTHWCYMPEDAPDVTDPPALMNGYVTFGSLNKAVKISGPCARPWARIMEAVPRSRLLISLHSADEAGELCRRLAEHGIPTDRLAILGKTRGTREYLERYHQIDIALDTFPFNGVTTTCDALWMGVPTISLSGDSGISRAGKSILHGAGLPKLACNGEDAFVKAAVDLTNDLASLRALRQALRERLAAAPVLNHRNFSHRLEIEYRTIWTEWCSGASA